MVLGQREKIWKPPQFPIQILNVHEQTLTGEACMNNACEGANKGFKAMFWESSSPTIWKVINAFLSCEVSSRQQMINAEQDRRYVRAQRPQQRMRDQRLIDLCQRIRDGDISMPDFFVAISHVFHDVYNV